MGDFQPKRFLFVRMKLLSLLVLLSFASAGLANSQINLDSRSHTLLVVGDSLSAAYNIPPQQGWVHLLRKQLQQRNKKIIVVNGSISGATTAAGLQNLPLLLAKHQPEYVILELGGNDGLQGKPVTYIKSNLSQLIKTAQLAGAEVLLVGIRLPPNFGKRYTEPFFNQYGDLADLHNIAYMPFLLEGVAGDDSLMQDDGIHPNVAAQPIILNTIWPYVEKLIGADVFIVK